MAGDLLVASGRVTPDYVEEMVQAVEDHGPYIVIAPGIALAHGRPSPAVIETGLSLVTLAMPVNFGSHNDPVRLVFGLSAFDHSSHLDTMKSLAELLGNEQFVNMLLNAQEESQIRQYFE
jgi:PTS system ascorbate-specific IIA component